MKKQTFLHLKKIKNSKKAYSVGFTWVYGLVSLFAVGLLYIVFDQVFVGHLVPTIVGQVTANTSQISTDTQVTIVAEISKYMDFWHALPYILFFVIVLYMILAGIVKERSEDGM